MPHSIQNNREAMPRQANLLNSRGLQGGQVERLSTGMRTQPAVDEPASLGISQLMRSETRGLSQAGRNVQDGLSLVQTANQALGDTGNLLQRVRVLAAQSGNSAMTDEDRATLQDEASRLMAQVDSHAHTTEYNGKKLLSGDFASDGLTIQAGADEGQVLRLTLTNATAKGLGLDGLAIDTKEGANAAVASLDAALSTVGTEQARLGSVQNRLQSTISDLGRGNVSDSTSRIVDNDTATATTSLTRQQILAQTAQSMMAQANVVPQSVYDLLR